MVPETWVAIDEFPNYDVSNAGRIRNAKTFRIMTPTANQKGIPNVILAKEGRYYRRAVAPIVAHTFLPEHPIRHYITPINLDGDRFNNHTRNLMWRPLWFARYYHAQFKEPWRCDRPVMIVESGEHFDYIQEMIVKYGLLERHILMGARNQEPVLNLNRHVRIL